jgi:hypothetical protein
MSRHINGLKILDEDAFLVSYPRSGNTWLRAMLTYIHPGSVLPPSDRNLHTLIPNLDQKPDPKTIPAPRVLKTHKLINAEHNKVIYLLRDGRDCMCSYFKFSKSEFGFEGSFLDFLKTPQFALRWSEHVDFWLGRNLNVLLVRYEKMLLDPLTSLLEVAAFLDWELPFQGAESAVSACRIENMRMRERSGEFLANVGGGTIGFWKEFFTDDELAYFMAEASETLEKYGYLKSGTDFQET